MECQNAPKHSISEWPFSGYSRSGTYRLLHWNTEQLGCLDTYDTVSCLPLLLCRLCLESHMKIRQETEVNEFASKIYWISHTALSMGHFILSLDLKQPLFFPSCFKNNLLYLYFLLQYWKLFRWSSIPWPWAYHHTPNQLPLGLVHHQVTKMDIWGAWSVAEKQCRYLLLSCHHCLGCRSASFALHYDPAKT